MEVPASRSLVASRPFRTYHLRGPTGQAEPEALEHFQAGGDGIVEAVLCLIGLNLDFIDFHRVLQGAGVCQDHCSEVLHGFEVRAEIGRFRRFHV
jgi:hypothetical protein